VLACNPNDVEAISAALLQVVQDEALRQRLVERGQQRLGLFRWQDSAARLVDACRRIAHRAPPAEAIAGQMIRQLHRFLQDSDADRQARLEVINRLGDILKETRANHFEVVQELSWESSLRLEAIHRLDSLLYESEL